MGGFLGLILCKKKGKKRKGKEEVFVSLRLFEIVHDALYLVQVFD